LNKFIPIAVVIIIIAIVGFALIPSLADDSIQICENNSKVISIKQASGFASIQARSTSPTLKQNTDVSIQPIGIYEFVLKPGSTGHVKMTYDFCPNTFGFQSNRTATHSELTELFQSYNSTNQLVTYLRIAKAENNNDSAIGEIPLAKEEYSARNATDVGLQIYTSDVTKINSHSVSLTYTIAADPSASQDTYIITNFYGICPAELLTIGDSPNEDSIKYGKGTFYGCPGA
jgi:hypothetical protein